MKANDRQVGGQHYRSAAQHWDFVASQGLGYFEGQITKYVSRWRKKNGLQDLEKAQHFLIKLTELSREDMAPVSVRTLIAVSKGGVDIGDFAAANELTSEEIMVCTRVMDWRATGEPKYLESAGVVLQHMIDTQRTVEMSGDAPDARYTNQG